MKHIFVLPFLLGMMALSGAVWGTGEWTGNPGAPVLAGCGGKILLFDESGTIVRSVDKNVGNMGDCHYLDSGNILYADAVSAKELAPDGSLVKEWTDPDGDTGDFTFSVQLTADGTVLIGVNNVNALLEYDRDGSLIRRVPLAFLDRQGSHNNMRWARKTSRGTYLVAHKAKGVVAEYDAEGLILRKMTVPEKEVYGIWDVPETGEVYATFLDCVVKFDMEGREVWRCSKEDLPELDLTYICSVYLRKNGNLVLGNYAANRGDTHAVCMFEITPGKKVVWSYRDPEGPDSFLGVEVLEKPLNASASEK